MTGKELQRIERKHFTAWDKERNPHADNAEYLDYKEINTGLSKDICSYGYVRVTELGNGATKHEWIKKSEAREHEHLLL